MKGVHPHTGPRVTLRPDAIRLWKCGDQEEHLPVKPRRLRWTQLAPMGCPVEYFTPRESGLSVPRFRIGALPTTRVYGRDRAWSAWQVGADPVQELRAAWRAGLVELRLGEQSYMDNPEEQTRLAVVLPYQRVYLFVRLYQGSVPVYGGSGAFVTAPTWGCEVAWGDVPRLLRVAAAYQVFLGDWHRLLEWRQPEAQHEAR